MSREHLYKAKRMNWKELPEGEWWVEGALFEGKENSYIFTNVKITDRWENSEIGADVTGYLVDSETICEYTGLTDKNGGKIFENDICDRKKEFPEIVTYHDGDWTLDYSYASGKASGYNYCNLGFYVRNRGGVEVISNIFDNPELLEGDE